MRKYNRWNTLKTAVNSKISWLLGNTNTFYTAYEFHSVANFASYYHRYKPVNPPMSSYLHHNRGGTSFNAALNRAKEIINTFNR